MWGYCTQTDPTPLTDIHMPAETGSVTAPVTQASVTDRQLDLPIFNTKIHCF